MYRTGYLALAVCALALFPGCNLLAWLDLPAPPFDATGTHAGTWSVTLPGVDEEISCSVKFSLEQDTEAIVPEDFHVRGTAQLNFLCGNVLEQLQGYGLPGAITLELDGLMTPAGQLLLGSPGTAQKNSMQLGIDGTGEDAGGDGAMDMFDGSFLLSIAYPEYPPVAVAGSFMTDRE